MKISECAEKEIEKLRASGINPTFRELLWLNEMGCKMEYPVGRTSPAKAGTPVKCGNRILWPFTLASQTWYANVACEIFDSELLLLYCLGYALSHGRIPGAFEDMNTYKDIRWKLIRWAIMTTATGDELQAAIVTVEPWLNSPHQIEMSEAERKNTISLDQAIAELVAGTGLPAEHWLTSLSDHSIKVLTAIREQASMMGGRNEDEEYKKSCIPFYAAVDKVRNAHTIKPRRDITVYW